MRYTKNAMQDYTVTNGGITFIMQDNVGTDLEYGIGFNSSIQIIEKWEGSLHVPHLFVIELTYNFSYGKKVKKINREVDYEKNDKGGAL